ncbi:MAG: Snf7 family protein [Candidatus Bathyarchaeia archaeon]
MSRRFLEGWGRDSKPPLTQRISGMLNATPLRRRITKTLYRLNMVQKRITERQTRLRHKERGLFKKCIRAQEGKDSATSTLYANECAQVRKMIQTLISSQLALEQVVLRLETVRDFGDVANEIVPAAAIIRSIRSNLAGVVPEASYMLGGIGETLDVLVMEVGEASSLAWNVMSSGEEAEKILAEAGAVAEQKMKEHFPELPTTEGVERGLNPP